MIQSGFFFFPTISLNFLKVYSLYHSFPDYFLRFSYLRMISLICLLLMAFVYWHIPFFSLLGLLLVYIIYICQDSYTLFIKDISYKHIFYKIYIYISIEDVNFILTLNLFNVENTSLFASIEFSTKLLPAAVRK